MANIDAPFGLRLVKKATGSPYSGNVRAYYIPSTYGTALFLGDPVVRTGTANTSEFKGFPIGSLPEVNKASAGDANAITGVIVGFEPNTQESAVYNAASTERLVYVADDPYDEFEIQADGAVAVTSVGLNANLIFTHDGDTATGLSGVELDTTSDVPAADASNQLTIIGVTPDVLNEANATGNIVRVRINNHSEAHAAVGL